VNIRKIIGWIFLVFVVFFIVSNPTKAATVSHNIWHGVTVAAQGASAFVDDL
jgi:predicted membrane channel-forming protein YqfA (hemolysin III family)